jgi:hypothetical protein
MAITGVIKIDASQKEITDQRLIITALNVNLYTGK